MLTIDVLASLFFFVVIIGGFLASLMLVSGLAYLCFPSMREEIKRDWSGKS